jgi:hypothetical protein
MKKTIIYIFLFFLISGCKKEDPNAPEDPAVAPTKLRTITNQWVSDKGGAGGMGIYESFKNFQYNFDVGENNQVVDITLSSKDVNIQYALFDPNGTRLDVISGGREVTRSFKLNAGKYRLVICAERRAVGTFELKMLGILGNPVLKDSQILQTGTQNWGNLGGAGKEKSFKNHLYTFEVTDDNTSIDAEMESSDTDVALYVYDELGRSLTDNYFAYRYRSFVLPAKKGTYTLMAASSTRGSVGNYKVNVFGKIANLKKIESQSASINGNWANNSAVDTYSLDLTSTSSPIDIDFSTVDAKAILELQNGVGSRIEYTVLSRNTDFIIRPDMPRGTYRIVIRPGRNDGFGNYKLNVFGQFTNFKKM